MRAPFCTTTATGNGDCPTGSDRTLPRMLLSSPRRTNTAAAFLSLPGSPLRQMPPISFRHDSGHKSTKRHQERGASEPDRDELLTILGIVEDALALIEDNSEEQQLVSSPQRRKHYRKKKEDFDQDDGFRPQ